VDRIRVWFPSARDESVFEQLRSAVEPVAEVFREEDGECDILIEGRPSDQQIRKVRPSGAVIVPFAGVPPATASLLAGNPQLSLHNLHHNAPETAETAVALLLAATRRIVTADRALRSGDWTPRYTPEECLRLNGLKAAVLGLGSIGSRVACVLAALGMDVVGIRRSGRADDVVHYGFSPFLEQGTATIRVTNQEQLLDELKDSNVLAICLPQTPETEGLIGREELELLRKPSALVNVARAQIVKERDLYDALKNGVLHAAGLDVWYRYPKHPEGVVPGYFDMPKEARHTFPSDYPFHELDNVVMSPHRGGASHSSEAARVEHLAQLIQTFASKGAMPNRVDLSAGY
jgi:phosphoglycerate dehydrogenase-like enzyme